MTVDDSGAKPPNEQPEAVNRRSLSENMRSVLLGLAEWIVANTGLAPLPKESIGRKICAVVIPHMGLIVTLIQTKDGNYVFDAAWKSGENEKFKQLVIREQKDADIIQLFKNRRDDG